MHAAGEWGQRKKKLLENAGPLKIWQNLMSYDW